MGWKHQAFILEFGGLQEVAHQRITLHVTQITVILTLSNQVEIWFVASYAQDLIPNKISAYLDQ